MFDVFPPKRMKSFTDLFIRRPVLALVVSLVILIAGFQAIRSLNVRQYPKLEAASIVVTTSRSDGGSVSDGSSTSGRVARQNEWMAYPTR